MSKQRNKAIKRKTKGGTHPYRYREPAPSLSGMEMGRRESPRQKCLDRS